MGHANAALEEMLEDGEISAQERGRMVWARTRGGRRSCWRRLLEMGSIGI
jgi:hypothetical protein